MKTYNKLKYTGNENGWHEPIVNLGKTKIQESHASELNEQFRNTGLKYEETTDDDMDVTATTDQADHGEPNLVVKDGKFVKTNNKSDVKAKEVAKEAVQEKGQADAKSTADDAFVKSDGEIKHAEKDTPVMTTTAGDLAANPDPAK